MIQSMTGFGKASRCVEGKVISVTIKTLNSKQQDLYLRIPPNYRERELELRTMLIDGLQRGKIDVNITIDNSTSSLNDVQVINYDAARHYYNVILDLHQQIDEEGLIDAPVWTDILRLPGVMKPKQETIEEIDDDEFRMLKDVIQEAINEVDNFRIQEGLMLYGVIKDNIQCIGRLLLAVNRPECERIQLLRQRIEESLQKVSADIDHNRLEQELIYYIEKLDINEEKSRLRNHLDYFLDTMDAQDAGQGKTLGFISQEIGREINTLGSKSNNAEMQQIVVKMKDHLEQIKEQVLNVL